MIKLSWLFVAPAGDCTLIVDLKKFAIFHDITDSLWLVQLLYIV